MFPLPDHILSVTFTRSLCTFKFSSTIIFLSSSSSLFSPYMVLNGGLWVRLCSGLCTCPCFAVQARRRTAADLILFVSACLWFSVMESSYVFFIFRCLPPPFSLLFLSYRRACCCAADSAFRQTVYHVHFPFQRRFFPLLLFFFSSLLLVFLVDSNTYLLSTTTTTRLPGQCCGSCISKAEMQRFCK